MEVKNISNPEALNDKSFIKYIINQAFYYGRLINSQDIAYNKHVNKMKEDIIKIAIKRLCI